MEIKKLNKSDWMGVEMSGKETCCVTIPAVTRVHKQISKHLMKGFQGHVATMYSKVIRVLE